MNLQNHSHLKNPQAGGAALEYILVTTFAAVVGIAALTFVGKAIKLQLGHLAEKLGLSDQPEIDLPFSESAPGH